MFKKSLAIALLALVPAVAFAQSAPGPAPGPAPQPTKPQQLVQWITCITLEGGYRIDMPGLATAGSEKVELKRGQSTTMYYNEVKKGPLGFTTSHMAYPKGYLDGNREAFFDNVRQGFVAKKELVRQRVLDGRSREFVLLREGTYMVVRAVLIGDRLFQAIVTGGGSADVDQDKEIRRFLDSFTVQA